MKFTDGYKFKFGALPKSLRFC